MHDMLLSLCLLSAALTRMEKLLLLYYIPSQDKTINYKVSPVEWMQKFNTMWLIIILVCKYFASYKEEYHKLT